jgi:hypothetical protein
MRRSASSGALDAKGSEAAAIEKRAAAPYRPLRVHAARPSAARRAPDRLPPATGPRPPHGPVDGGPSTAGSSRTAGPARGRTCSRRHPGSAPEEARIDGRGEVISERIIALLQAVGRDSEECRGRALALADPRPDRPQSRRLKLRPRTAASPSAPFVRPGRRAARRSMSVRTADGMSLACVATEPPDPIELLQRPGLAMGTRQFLHDERHALGLDLHRGGRRRFYRVLPGRA